MSPQFNLAFSLEEAPTFGRGSSLKLSLTHLCLKPKAEAKEYHYLRQKDPSNHMVKFCFEDRAKGWQSITDKEFFSIDFWEDFHG
jgi:hypothetical protein